MHNTGHKKLQLSAPVPVPCCFMEYLYRVPTLPFSISSLSPLSPYSSPRSRLCTRITTTKSPTTSDSWIRARDTDPWSPNSKQPRRISAGNGVFNIGSIKLNADGIGRGVGDERRKTTEEIGEGAGGDSSRCVLSGRVLPLLPLFYAGTLRGEFTSVLSYFARFIEISLWKIVEREESFLGRIRMERILSSKNRADCNGIKIYSHRFYNVIGLPVVRTKGY